jgi:hypothetical protein
MREKDTISGQERTLRWSRFDADIYIPLRTKGRPERSASADVEEGNRGQLTSFVCRQSERPSDNVQIHARVQNHHSTHYR